MGGSTRGNKLLLLQLGGTRHVVCGSTYGACYRGHGVIWHVCSWPNNDDYLDYLDCVSSVVERAFATRFRHALCARMCTCIKVGAQDTGEVRGCMATRLRRGLQ